MFTNRWPRMPGQSPNTVAYSEKSISINLQIYLLVRIFEFALAIFQLIASHFIQLSFYCPFTPISDNNFLRYRYINNFTRIRRAFPAAYDKYEFSVFLIRLCESIFVALSILVECTAIKD